MGAIKTLCLGADKFKKAKAQTLKTEFESLKMKDTKQLDNFCMRLNGLVTNLRALGEAIEEEYIVKKVCDAQNSCKVTAIKYTPSNGLYYTDSN